MVSGETLYLGPNKMCLVVNKLPGVRDFSWIWVVNVYLSLFLYHTKWRNAVYVIDRRQNVVSITDKGQKIISDDRKLSVMKRYHAAKLFLCTEKRSHFYPRTHSSQIKLPSKSEA